MEWNGHCALTTHVIELKGLILEELGDAIDAQLAGMHNRSRIEDGHTVVVGSALLALVERPLAHSDADTHLPWGGVLPSNQSQPSAG